MYCRQSNHTRVKGFTNHVLTSACPQVAGLAHKYPGLVACRCMSYLQEGAPASAPQTPSPSQALSVEALPSTRADVQTPARPGGPGAAAGGAADGVPRITFLYKLVPGVADRSFGASLIPTKDHGHSSLCKSTCMVSDAGHVIPVPLSMNSPEAQALAAMLCYSLF